MARNDKPIRDRILRKIQWLASHPDRSEAFLRARHTEMTGRLGADVADLAITGDKGSIAPSR